MIESDIALSELAEINSTDTRHICNYNMRCYLRGKYME